LAEIVVIEEKGATIAGGVTELGIAGIAVLFLAALDRAAKETTQVRCTRRFMHDDFKVAEYSSRWSLLNMCQIFV
jgi:hypothetical protein